MGKIVSINVSNRKRVPKKPVEEAVLVPGMGLAEDAHAAPGERQVSLLMLESIERQRSLMEQGDRQGAAESGSLDAAGLVPGIYAENLTTKEIDLTSLQLGDELRVGEGTRLRVTKIGKECHTKCAIYNLVGDCVMPREGIFCAVLKGGKIRTGDNIERC
jgi:MOSC domain-containing protein YiiM